MGTKAVQLQLWKLDTSAKFRCGCKRFFIVVSIFLSRSTSFLDFLLQKVYNLKTKLNKLPSRIFNSFFSFSMTTANFQFLWNVMHFIAFCENLVPSRLKIWQKTKPYIRDCCPDINVGSFISRLKYFCCCAESVI